MSRRRFTFEEVARLYGVDPDSGPGTIAQQRAIVRHSLRQITDEVTRIMVLRAIRALLRSDSSQRLDAEVRHWLWLAAKGKA